VHIQKGKESVFPTVNLWVDLSHCPLNTLMLSFVRAEPRGREEVSAGNIRLYWRESLRKGSPEFQNIVVVKGGKAASYRGREALCYLNLQLCPVLREWVNKALG
jgi:hypothetical protein